MNENDSRHNKELFNDLTKLTDRIITQAEMLKSKGTDLSEGIGELGALLYDELTKDSGKAASVGLSLDRSRYFKTADNNNIFNNEMLKTALLLILNSSLSPDSSKKPADSVLINGIRQSLAGSLSDKEINSIDISSFISYDSYTSYDSFISDIRAVSDMINRINRINNPEYDLAEDIKLIKEDEERINKVSVSALMINTLYKDTLLENAVDKKINVLVLGSDKYCSEFIDKCLMVGQVPDHRLSITSVSEDSGSYMKKYLEGKPALTDFVKIINGDEVINDDIRDEYACLKFSGHDCINKLHPDTSLTSTVLNRIYAGRILADAGKNRYTYIFISLGSEVLNYCAAAAFHKQSPEMTVNYICRTGFVRASGIGLNPIAIDDVRIDGLEVIDKNLNRIAFNIHKVWSRNDDADKVRKQYLSDDYCRNSAMTFAVSVKYKLQALGISFDDTQKAAAEFSKLIKKDALHHTITQSVNSSSSSDSSEADPKLTARKKLLENITRTEDEKKMFSDILSSPIAKDMAFAEHKRWVIEKVTNGWTALPSSEFEKFLRDFNTEKDTNPEKPRHSCIVRSENNFPLAALEPAKWDNITDLRGYDELDIVSLRMHQAAARIDRKEEIFAAVRKLENIFGGLSFSENSDECTSPKYIFNSFRYAVQQILNGSQNYGYRFDEIFDDISAYPIPQEDKNSLRNEQLDIIRKALYPKAFANKLYDYKINDILFIENIPQVIGCPEHISLMTAFNDGRYSEGNDAVFANAASSLVIHPDEIVYLYNFDKASDPAELEQKLRNVVRLLQRKHVPAAKQPEDKPASGISLIILNSLERPASSRIDLSRLILSSLGIPNDSSLMKVCGVNIKVAVAKNRNDFYDIIRAYAADTLFDGSSELFSSSVEQGEFMHDIIKGCDFRYFEFDPKNESFENIRNCDFLGYLKSTARLKAEDVFAFSDAYLVHYENDGRFVSQGELSDCSQSYRKFWNHFLYGPTGQRPLRFYGDNNGNTEAWNTAITNFSNQIKEKYPNSQERLAFENIPLKKPEYAEIFKAFCEDPEAPDVYTGKTSKDGVLVKKYSFNERTNQLSVEFTDMQAKNILTKAGETLELFCYHEVMKTGYFDDVISGYEFKRNGVKNELDLLLTKGTRTFIVECKAQRKLDASYYYKLDSIAHNIGINCTCVLVGYAYRDHYGDTSALNDLQRNRGRQLDIITVSDLNDIENIGQMLIEIAEGRYQPSNNSAQINNSNFRNNNSSAQRNSSNPRNNNSSAQRNSSNPRNNNSAQRNNPNPRNNRSSGRNNNNT